MIYFEMKPYAVSLTVYQENTRNKAFTNVCTLLFDFSKKNMRCLSSKICLTKNCTCRYEVFTGHRRVVDNCDYNRVDIVDIHGG